MITTTTQPRETAGRHGRGAASLLAASLLVALLAGCATPAPPPPLQRHAVAAANPHAAGAALEILRRGGSAVDAAIAAQMVLTLVEPQSSGIGGGAFLLNYTPGRPEAGIAPALDAYDGRERAPAGATPRMFIAPGGKPLKYGKRAVGGRAVGVPGVVRMLELAHRAHGRLPWRALFQPAIALAEKGFAVSRRLNRMIRRDPHLKNFAAARSYFFTPDGEAKPAGTVLRNPALADTLRRIADRGADAFYRGEIARDIARAVREAAANPGTMTADDLASYRARRRPILCRPYRVWRVCGMGPPTSGGIATLQILGLLERFDLSRMKPGSVQAVHLISEASRLAYADRNQYVGDPDFVSVPVAGLLDRAYLDARSRLISAARSMGRAAPGVPPRRAVSRFATATTVEAPSTSQISVIDSFGNAVSMTTSVATAFGARLMVRGFMLNSQLADFSPRPEIKGAPVVNRVAPGKRPRSSMSPTLVLDRDGRLVMTVGSPGGSRIIGYVVKTLIGVLDWKLSLQDAVSLPNHTNRNGHTDLERGTALEDIAADLEALGHRVRIRRLTSGLHGLMRTPRGIEGGADPRREGVVVGD